MSATVESILSFVQSQASSTPLTESQYNNFVSQLRAQINELSVRVPGAQPGAVTLLYSGMLDGSVHSGDVAEALANANPGSVLTINKTEVGKLLDSKNETFQKALESALGPASDPTREGRLDALLNGTVTMQSDGTTTRTNNGLWDDASRRFAEAATGEVKTITGLSNPQRVYSQTEFPASLNNSNVTKIDGIPKSYYQKLLADGYSLEQVRDIAARARVGRTRLQSAV